MEELAETGRSGPMFNANRLKLGVFGTNVSNGCAVSLAPTSFEPTFEHNLEIAAKAEHYGFEALVPVGRWKGFGGPSDFNGTCMEVYTWAAALAARTSEIAIFATSHVSTIHPIVAAKQAATIDQISGGRFGVNVVCGWFSDEMDMFGGSQMEHDTRYRHADEWVQIARRLWTEQEFDHEGEFFKIKGGYLLPKPVQKSGPVLINAGISPAGRDFAARHMDFSFTLVNTLEGGREVVEDMHQRAAAYGRQIGMIANAVVVCRETEQEARDAYQHIVDNGDWVATENILTTFGVQSQSMDDATARAMAERFVAGWGGYPLVGTPEQVAEGLAEMSKIGIDLVLLSWLDYNEEISFFGDRVMPLLKQAGLRS